MFTESVVFELGRADDLDELAEVHNDCDSWRPDRFMRQLWKPGTRKEALVASHFLRRVWREINERYL